MSLINDALKRANEANPSPGQPPPETSAPMVPVAPPPGHQSVGLPRYFFPVLLCVFSGACWFLVRGWDARRHAGLYPEPTKAIFVQAREIPAESSPAQTSPEQTSPEQTSPELVGAVDPAMATEPLPVPEGRQFALENPAPVARTATAPAAPAYRLQGIFYRPSNPSAVIDTKTVFIGDRIYGARVKAIDRQSVTLEVNGETRVLEINE